MVVHKCSNLHISVPPGRSRPYVSYIVPGHKLPYDTGFGAGADPEFRDVARFPMVRSSELEDNLRHRILEVGLCLIASSGLHPTHAHPRQS